MSSSPNALPPAPHRSPGPADFRRDSSARVDALLVVASAALAGFLSVHFNLSERIQTWTAPWEGLQLDELPQVLIVLASALAWFAWRRSADAERQLVQRRTAEAALDAALKDNRRLAQQHVAQQESDRKRLARELHDELGQYLNVIKLDAVTIGCDPAFAGSLARERAAAIVDNCDHIHRSLTAIVRELRPVGLDELGLQAAVEHCLAAWRRRLPSTRIELTVSGDFSKIGEMPGLTAYRVIQEAMTNAAKHASARAISVRLERRPGKGASPGTVAVTVADDGTGVAPSVDATATGLGLIGMRERVTALSGTLEVSTSPGAGFTLSARIPEDVP